VKLNKESDEANSGSAADRPETVEVDAVEGEEVGVLEAAEALDEEVTQLYELGESRDGELAELSDDVADQAAEIDDLRDGLAEVAEFFAELIEEAGGEVDYDHIEIDRSESPIPEVIENMDIEVSEA